MIPYPRPSLDVPMRVIVTMVFDHGPVVEMCHDGEGNWKINRDGIAVAYAANQSDAEQLFEKACDETP